ncbi:MAG: PQQ-dependent sugar dehydrogenase [Chloroflexota bacterium]|nr:MAG: PQQ-dependent sugar dehydrogenase [Chloroflexota bacterium]
MKHRRFLIVLLIAGALVGAAAAIGRTAAGSFRSDDIPPGFATSARGSVSIRLDPIASGLNRPVGIANAGDHRLFVIEQSGTIRIVEPDGSVRPTPFLDIRDRVDSSSSELGLLGLAFHPAYRQNGYFYLNYTSSNDAAWLTRISRFMVTANANIADAASEEILLTVDQPFRNHNAGKILFGPDGYLYIPLGDGGSGGDPEENAQNMRLLLGKVSRIDVNGGQGSPPDCVGSGTGSYAIPADNPFVDGPSEACDEIWALGLRNPWQSSFDSRTGDFFIADVGQKRIEEVDFQPAGSPGGENYGWDCYEGSQPYVVAQDPVICDTADAYTFPIFEYDQQVSDDCSITGGYVYRGQLFPALEGRYLLTDYCSGRFWDLLQLADRHWQPTSHDDPGLLRRGNAAFGERCDGELFVANVLRGEVYHLVADPKSVPVLTDPHLFDGFAPEAWLFLPVVSESGCR